MIFEGRADSTGRRHTCPLWDIGYSISMERGKGRDTMTNTSIYQSIATRTAGDIYIGVVGPG